MSAMDEERLRQPFQPTEQELAARASGAVWGHPITYGLPAAGLVVGLIAWAITGWGLFTLVFLAAGGAGAALYWKANMAAAKEALRGEMREEHNRRQDDLLEKEAMEMDLAGNKEMAATVRRFAEHKKTIQRKLAARSSPTGPDELQVETTIVAMSFGALDHAKRAADLETRISRLGPGDSEKLPKFEESRKELTSQLEAAEDKLAQTAENVEAVLSQGADASSLSLADLTDGLDQQNEVARRVGERMRAEGL